MAKSKEKSGDKSHLPWSIKGISPEAREIAREAAAEQGVTMGEWLTGVIERMGTDISDDPVDDVQADASDGSHSREGGLSDKIAELNFDLDVLRDRISERLSGTEEKLQAVVTPLSEIISEMVERLDRLENHQSGAEESSEAMTIDYSNSSLERFDEN